MNHTASHRSHRSQHSQHAQAGDGQAGSEAFPVPSSSLPVGDVVIRREEAGYGIFNYRGEPVLELPLRTSAEAERVAAEIVLPWRGHVRIDESVLGD